MVYLVLGVMRSGTSLLSSILLKSGVYMGDRFQDPHPTFQPNGFYEDLDFLDLNEKILVKLGGSVGAGMLYHSIPTDPQILSVASPFSQEMKSLVESRQQNYQNWGFKDPRLITTYLAWKQYLPEHRIVWAYRNPENVVKSIARSSKITTSQFQEIYNIVSYYIDRLGQTLTNSIQVDFDLLRAKNKYEVWRLANRLSIKESTILGCIK